VLRRCECAANGGLSRLTAVAALVAAALAAAPASGAAPAAPACGGRVATTSQLGAPGRVLAWRAVIVSAAPIRDAPSGMPSRIGIGDASAVLVLGAHADAQDRCWLRVRLPWRPNGASGWIEARHVRLRATPWRIEVNRAERRVTLLDSGVPVLTDRAVVGKPSTPTPTGVFAVAGVWRSAPTSFVGAYVLGLTAHGEKLSHFDGGDGLVALHGRGGTSLRDPLGTARSHGCVRLDNAAITAIVQRIGAGELSGTPVSIS
jgi:lipoprotein-anchoring transpeptidase ErfK/SrfK